MPMSRDEFEACCSELARELAMRRRLYPKWVGEGKLKQADERIRLMQQVYDWIVEQLPTTATLF